MTKETEYKWTIEDEKILSRVLELMKDLETTHAFSKRCGLDAGNFGKFKNRKISMGITYLRRIATANNVSLKWLVNGEGEKEDESGMVSEPIPVMKPSPAHDKDGNTKDMTIELLKAENKALYAVIQSVNDNMELIKETLKQNAEAMSQNRILMQYLVSNAK